MSAGCLLAARCVEGRRTDLGGHYFLSFFSGSDAINKVLLDRRRTAQSLPKFRAVVAADEGAV